MALKPCKECGTQVSTKAEACPSCGAPLQENKRRNRKGCGCFSLFLFVIIGLPMLMSWSQAASEKREEEQAQRREEARERKAAVEEKRREEFIVSIDEHRIELDEAVAASNWPTVTVLVERFRETGAVDIEGHGEAVDQAEEAMLLAKLAELPNDALDEQQDILLRLIQLDEQHKAELQRVNAALTEIRVREREERKGKRQAVLNLADVKHDAMEKIRWYNASVFYRKPETYLKAYVGLADGRGKKPYMRLVIHTSGDEWLFAETVKIAIGDARYELAPSHGTFSWERDNSGGSTWEWIDVPAEDHLPMLRKIANAKEPALMRVIGDNKYREVHVDGTMRQGLLDMLAVLEVLGEPEP